MRAFFSKLRNFLINVIYVLMLITAAYSVLFTFGPMIETKFFPVVVDFKISSISQFDTNRMDLEQVTFNKVRPCDYVGTSWFHGRREDGPFERVTLELRRSANDVSSPNRPLGLQKTGPWIIGIDNEKELLTNSFAELQHRCHPLWITTTRFFP